MWVDSVTSLWVYLISLTVLLLICTLAHNKLYAMFAVFEVMLLPCTFAIFFSVIFSTFREAVQDANLWDFWRIVLIFFWSLLLCDSRSICSAAVGTSWTQDRWWHETCFQTEGTAYFSAFVNMLISLITISLITCDLACIDFINSAVLKTSTQLILLKLH